MNEQHDVHDDMDLINIIDAVMKVAKPNGHDAVDNMLAMTAALCRFWALSAKPTADAKIVLLGSLPPSAPSIPSVRRNRGFCAARVLAILALLEPADY
jgi:hypothetical protein